MSTPNSIPMKPPPVIESIDQLDLDMTKALKVASWLINVGTMAIELYTSANSMENYLEAQNLVNVLHEEGLPCDYQAIPSAKSLASYTATLGLIGQNFVLAIKELKNCDTNSAFSFLAKEFKDESMSWEEWVTIGGTLLLGASLAIATLGTATPALVTIAGGLGLTGGALGIGVAIEDYSDGEISGRKAIVDALLSAIGAVAGTAIGVAGGTRLLAGSRFVSNANTVSKFENLATAIEEERAVQAAVFASDNIDRFQGSQVFIDAVASLENEGFSYDDAVIIVDNFVAAQVAQTRELSKYTFTVRANNGANPNELTQEPKESDLDFQVRRMYEWLRVNGGAFSRDKIEMPPDIRSVYTGWYPGATRQFHIDFDGDGNAFHINDDDDDNDGISDDVDANPYNRNVS